jgi:uncharacterized membrane protein YfcA
LGTPQAISSIGFIAGFTWTIPLKKLVKYPLSSIFGGAICGILTSFGAEIVSEFLPRTLKPIVSISLIISSGYYTIKNISKDDKDPSKPMVNISYESTRPQ